MATILRFLPALLVLNWSANALDLSSSSDAMVATFTENGDCVNVSADALLDLPSSSNAMIAAFTKNGGMLTTSSSRRRRRRRRRSAPAPGAGSAADDAALAKIKSDLKGVTEEMKTLKSTLSAGLDKLTKKILTVSSGALAPGTKCCKDPCGGSNGNCFKGLFCCPAKKQCLDSKTKMSQGPNCDACKKSQAKDMDEEDKKLSSVCATEGGTCKCKGMVYYGKRFLSGKPGSGASTNLEHLKKHKYKEKYSNGEIKCNVGAFGGDPLYGYYKHCICVPGPSTAKNVVPPTKPKPAPAPPPAPAGGGSYGDPMKGKPMGGKPADPCPKPMRKRSNGVCSWISKESHGYRTMELAEGVGIIKKACDSSSGCTRFTCTKAALG